jgi:integrase
MIEPRWSAHNQKWSISIYSNGKRVKTFWSGKPGTAGKREVLKKYNAYMNGTDTSITVAAEWARYLDSLTARTCPEALRNVISISNHHILPKCGKRKLSAMRVTDWQQVINSCQKLNGEPLSKKTLRTIRATIVQFLKYCELDGIDVPSGAALYAPKNAPTVGKEIIPLQAVTRLFDPSEPFSGDYFIHLFRFMCVTGLRPGEAIGLQHGDYSDGWITINRSVNRMCRITPGKNDNARRHIKLADIAIKELKEQIQMTVDLNSPWIFPDTKGDVAIQGTVYEHWKRIAAQLGCPNTCLYSFRHTFISMASVDLPQPMLKAAVGHSVDFDTYGVYAHMSDQQLAQAADILDNSTFKTINQK